MKTTLNFQVRAGFKPAPYCLLALLLPLFAFAQNNGITISNFSAKAGSPATLTFNVQWAPLTNGMAWSDTVWVFVDYNNKGTMTRLPLDPTAATLTWHSATNCPSCGVDRVRSNPNGVWVVGNARTSSSSSFSATVLLPAATATATATLAGACIYAVNYPPEGTYTSASTITLKGTKPYNMVLEGSSGTVLEQSAGSVYAVPAGSYVQSFTDATGAPGVLTPATFTLNQLPDVYCAGSPGVGFSLSGTQPGVTYHLMNKSAGLVASLAGTGGAAMFSGTFSVGEYYARSEPTAVYREVVSGTHIVTMNPIPPAPTNPSAKVYCALGARVPFSATPPAGCTIDWYTADTGGSIVSDGYGVESFLPRIMESTTYYAQARDTTTGCVSATRVAATGTINFIPIAPFGPSANKRCGPGTVTFKAKTMGEEITTDWYTAATGGSTLSGGYGVTSFSPEITESTTYYAQARVKATGCISVSRLAVGVTINPIPAAPINPSANARCTSGTVTFSAATVTAGSTIDWYTTDSGDSFLSNGQGQGVTSFSPTIKKSTTYYAESRDKTTKCVSATRLAVTGTVVNIPPAPTDPSANARCGAGTVTFSATPPAGCTIDWYNPGNTSSASVSGGQGVTSISPTITESTTYYARARVNSVRCLSNERLAVSATVNVNPTVSISPSTVLAASNTTVTFTANANNCNLCKHKWSNSSTAENMSVIAPDHDKTVYYSCTVTSSVGCTASAKASVEGCLFYSKATWRFGGYTWSDRVVTRPSGCTAVASLSTENNPPPQYKVYNKRYYYNWSCVNQHPTQLCPPGWSVPTSDQLNALKQAVTPSELASAWGDGGYADGSSMSFVSDVGAYWSSTEYGGSFAHYLVYTGSEMYVNNGYFKYFGLQVRCVKQ